jgi:hypothetical protein
LHRVEDYDPADEGEKARMLAKLFSLYPPQPDVELRASAYMEELAGIPWRWVSAALRVITEEPGRVFCPSINEVKGAVAGRIRAARRLRDGGYNAHQAGGGNDDGQIRWLLEQVHGELQRGILPPGAATSPALPAPDDDFVIL